MTTGFAASDRRCGRTLLIDGRSGAGKTDLASQLADELECALVHVEHFYPGWEGLDEGAQWLVDAVLEPRSRGEIVRLREWDWYTGGFRDGGELLPERVRGAVARARDGGDDWWELWRQQEDALYAREQSVALADAVLEMPNGADELRRLLANRGFVVPPHDGFD